MIDFGFGNALITDPITLQLLEWVAADTYAQPRTIERCYERSGADPDAPVDIGGNVLPLQTRVFHLWKSQLSGYEPKEADIIVWDEFGTGVLSNYTVKRVFRYNHGARFKLLCLAEVTP